MCPGLNKDLAIWAGGTERAKRADCGSQTGESEMNGLGMVTVVVAVVARYLSLRDEGGRGERETGVSSGRDKSEMSDRQDPFVPVRRGHPCGLYLRSHSAQVLGLDGGTAHTSPGVADTLNGVHFTPHDHGMRQRREGAQSMLRDCPARTWIVGFLLRPLQP